MTPPFRLDLPEQRQSCVVFASPHSGRDYSTDFLARTVLDRQAIRSSEDAFVDELFAAAPRFGAPLLCALAPRAYVDLNRSVDELDPALIDGVRALAHNPRVGSGLGVIPRVVANGRAIYRGKLTLTEARARLTGVWHPYHRALQQVLDDHIAMFGEAILVDCHSMPHEAIESCGLRNAPRPEVVIGDRFGASASPAVVDAVEAVIRDAGLRVGRNAPFAGAYVTQHYGRPSRQQHVLQIEIDRAIYMDERQIEPNKDFEAVRTMMLQITAGIAAIGRHGVRLAAE
jgi:N-formylglutamate amidohydrolase